MHGINRAAATTVQHCALASRSADVPNALLPGSGSGDGDGGMGRGMHEHGAVAKRKPRWYSDARAPGCLRGRRCVTRFRWEEHSLHMAALRISWPVYIPLPGFPDKCSPPAAKSREVGRPKQCDIHLHRGVEGNT